MTIVSDLINLTVALIPGAVVSQGLGAPCYVCIEDATPIAGGFTTVGSASDVAALLTATQISAQAADDLTTALSETFAPPLIYVASYDAGAGIPETPDVALDVMESAGNDFGVIAQESRTDADNSTVATWVTASAERKWAHPAILQSASADLITTGKPPALTPCETETVYMHYTSTASEPQAAAHFGMIGGFSFIAGPMAARIRITGVDLPTVTGPEAAFAIANDAALLMPLGLGASANQRMLQMTKNYAGSGFSGALTIAYAVRRMAAAIQGVVQRYAILGDPLYANTDGTAAVSSAVSDALADMASQTPSHFTPGVTGPTANRVPLPEGFQVTDSFAGSVITISVLLLIGQEATRINLAVIGEEQ